MKPRESNLPPPKLDMTPMIDVVFQLMIFFMLTLKIVTAEGNFDINMPIGQSTSTSNEIIPDIKVRLIAAPDGTLQNVMIGQRPLGAGDQAFASLNSQILRLIGRPGNPLTKDMEVEIDADYNLHYAHVIQAIGACTGRLDERTGQIVRYVEKIKFAPPRKPTG